ncbi:hypothetical protein ACHAQA_003800 [Verticillium albo-atrum]
MADLYQLESEMPDSEHDEATCHILEVMGVMDLPNVVLGRTKPPIGIWKRLRESQDTWQTGRLEGVEVVSGLPRSLLDIFASIFDNDKDYTEARLIKWPGEVGNYLQCHLWDCWRLSGVLEVRRRQRCKLRRDSIDQPPSEVIMCQLMASMDALYRASMLPRNDHILVRNALIYPLLTAGLEITQLEKHGEWKDTIDEIRNSFEQQDYFNLVGVTFDLLDEAWSEGSEFFDMDEAARRRDVEVALF